MSVNERRQLLDFCAPVRGAQEAERHDPRPRHQGAEEEARREEGGELRTGEREEKARHAHFYQIQRRMKNMSGQNLANPLAILGFLDVLNVTKSLAKLVLSCKQFCMSGISFQLHSGRS